MSESAFPALLSFRLVMKEHLSWFLGSLCPKQLMQVEFYVRIEFRSVHETQLFG